MKREKVEVEVLPSGNCQGSLDWWLEDVAMRFRSYYCVGEGGKRSKNYLGLLSHPDTEI